MPLPVEPSSFLSLSFIALSLVMLIGFAGVTRSWAVLIGGGVWAAFTGGLAAIGFFADVSVMPPRLLFVLFPMLVIVFGIAFSSLGTRCMRYPLGLLVGYQAFRIIVEWLIHVAVEEGVAPPQMSWNGLNFDVLTGITALLIFPFAARLPKWALLLWNTIGLGLLITVAAVGIISSPTPFQVMEPDNIWILHFPFVWLPAVLVAFALLGHVLLYRRLLTSKEATPS